MQDRINKILLIIFILFNSQVFSQWQPFKEILSGYRPFLLEKTGTPVYAAAVGNEGKLHLVWANNDNSKSRIYYSSLENGVWNKPIRLSNESNNEYFPRIAINKNNEIHCVWLDYSNPTSAKVMYAFCNSYGKWENPIIISDTTKGLSNYPVLALDSNETLHVMWNESQSPVSPLFYIVYRTLNKLSGWSDFLPVPKSTWDGKYRVAYRPALAFDNKNLLHCIWYDGDWAPNRNISYSYLENNKWSESVVIDSGYISDDSPIAFCIDKNYIIHAIWYEYKTNSGKYSFKEYGKLWSTPVHIQSRGYQNILVSNSKGNLLAIWPTPDGGYKYNNKINGQWGQVFSIGNKDTSLCPEAVIHNDSVYLFSLNYGISNKTVFTFAATNQITGISNNEKIKNIRFCLFQNYPNPFNPKTTIKYSIPYYSNVKLKIFDMIGREITTLVNQNQEKGEYSVNFDGSSLSGGMYIYQFTTENYSDVRKFILLK